MHDFSTHPPLCHCEEIFNGNRTARPRAIGRSFHGRLRSKHRLRLVSVPPCPEVRRGEFLVPVRDPAPSAHQTWSTLLLQAQEALLRCGRVWVFRALIRGSCLARLGILWGEERRSKPFSLSQPNREVPTATAQRSFR